MKNALIGALATALVGVIIWAVFLKNPNAGPAVSPTPFLVTTSTPTSTNKATPSVSPTGMTTAKGTVEGRLCYPSSFLPKGSIEAKNVVTNEISTQEYPGSENGGKSSYSFDLPVGTYILRYKATVSSESFLYGYHTETCLTGSEVTCAATNPRVQVKADVKGNQKTSNMDLCDFYYDSKNPPSF